MQRSLVPVLALAAALALPGAARAELLAYQADRKLEPGTAAPGGAAVLVLLAPRDGYAAGQISVLGAGGSVSWAPETPHALVERTSFALVGRTRVRGALQPDPLPPLAGAAVPGPAVLFVRVSTEGMAAGYYPGTLRVGAESIQVALTVTTWALPSRTDGFRSLFLIQPQTYFETVDRRAPLAVAQVANRALFDLLARYRIGPGDWGYGTPTRTGYRDGNPWHTRRATIMRTQADLGFNTLRIPLSTQHQASGRWIGNASPHAPWEWRPWLSIVRPFWVENGWTDRAVAWAWDEPGRVEQKLLADQATFLHRDFPEAKLLSTLTPLPGNRYLRDGGRDDVDIWAVLSRRFYGFFGRQRSHYDGIRQLRARGKEIWTYTYHGVAGTPGYDATEPLTNVRLFFAWNALEGADGTLYSDGLARYKGLDPWQQLPDDGQSVFIYPGTPEAPAPVPSLRLEAIRDGIQDANLFKAYAKRFGRPALVRLLAQNGLFAARDSELLLGCVSGCDLKAPTKYAWPIWQRDEVAASAGLLRARAVALFALSPDQPPAR